MSARKMRILAAGALLALGGLMACNYIGDDNGCDSLYNPKYPTQSCRFGPPADLDGKGECPNPITVNKDGAGCDGNTWGAIWSEIAGSCSSANCHDNGAGSGPKVYLPLNDADKAYANLAKYPVGCGKNYIDTEEPENSQILNNLNGVSGSGTAMPLNSEKLSDETLATIKAWVACGAQP